MATSTARPSYAPDVPPQDIIEGSEADRVLRWSRREFDKLARAPGNTTFFQFLALNAAPTKPKEGMAVYADGTNWNPGFGEGEYVYSSGGLWVPLSNPLSGQIPGTATNDNAATGKVGEYIESEVLQGSAVGLVSGTPKSVTSIALTAGDWDVSAAVTYSLGATTTMSLAACIIGTVVDTWSGVVSQDNRSAFLTVTFSAGQTQVIKSGPARFSLSGNQTVYLTAYSVFATSTNSASGIIRARRMR